MSRPEEQPVRLSGTDPRSAWTRWTWERCREQILTLKHRLGYGEHLWALGFRLLDDGRLLDPFRGIEVFDPSVAGPPVLIPSRYNAVPEIYCLLSTYACAPDTALAGETLSLAAIDPVRRAELSTQDCAGLLRYAGQDVSALQSPQVPFFGKQLDQADLAFEVWPLPKVPVTFVLWQGDDEVTDGGTVLFDRSASQLLPGLLAELAWLTVWRLQNILDPEKQWGYHRGEGLRS